MLQYLGRQVAKLLNVVSAIATRRRLSGRKWRSRWRHRLRPGDVTMQRRELL